MKRVIDISEDAYELLLEKGACGKFANLGVIVANSTPIEQEPTDKNFTKADIDAIVKAINEGWELRINEILSKIKAEIEQLPTTECTETRRIYIDADDFKENVLAILDKYKAEQE